MPRRIASEEYVEMAKKLTKAQADHLFMRMGHKLGRMADDRKLTVYEALAIQLEIEDENLREWRERFSDIKERDRKRALKESKHDPF